MHAGDADDQGVKEEKQQANYGAQKRPLSRVCVWLFKSFSN